MFRLSSLGHHQVVSLYRGNYAIYDDTIRKIKSLFFSSSYLSFVTVSNTMGMAHLKIIIWKVEGRWNCLERWRHMEENYKFPSQAEASQT